MTDGPITNSERLNDEQLARVEALRAARQVFESSGPLSGRSVASREVSDFLVVADWVLDGRLTEVVERLEVPGDIDPVQFADDLFTVMNASDDAMMNDTARLLANTPTAWRRVVTDALERYWTVQT